MRIKCFLTVVFSMCCVFGCDSLNENSDDVPDGQIHPLTDGVEEGTQYCEVAQETTDPSRVHSKSGVSHQYWHLVQVALRRRLEREPREGEIRAYLNSQDEDIADLNQQLQERLSEQDKGAEEVGQRLLLRRKGGSL